MRVIERQMNEAIRFCRNWGKDNTSVHFDDDTGVSVVRLYGNKIAEVDRNGVTIFDGGYQSNTTKSRLNAIIDEFCNAIACGVHQDNYQWFIRDHVITQPFTNGYHFAA